MLTIDEMARAIVRREGGWVDDPDDAGGATNHGVSLRYAIGIGLDLDGDQDTDKDDIRMVTPEIAAELYKEDFYLKPGFQHLPPEVQPQMFDIAVNGSPAKAVELLQRAINSFPDPDIGEDGKLGAITRRVAASIVQQYGGAALNNALCDERGDWYRDIAARRPSQRKFLQGWLNRTEEFRA